MRLVINCHAFMHALVSLFHTKREVLWTVYSQQLGIWHTLSILSFDIFQLLLWDKIAFHDRFFCSVCASTQNVTDMEY